MPDSFFGLYSADQRQTAAVLTVAGLLRRIKAEFSRTWSDVRVRGEIRSIKAYPSGHVYFDLKDDKEDALISCVMFRRDALRLSFSPKMGDLVELTGELNVYEPRGQLNFIARQMTEAGAGALYARFLALKDALAKEGLFDEALKRQIPLYPKTVGIVTSLQAAALRDALKTLNHLAPWVNVVIYPTAVQGAQAEGEILSALESADARGEVDVLLLVRGGGSLADLWSFNSEAIARRLRTMSLPVVCGVGHETDFTIADFASDVRAATPTAAAQRAVAGWQRINQRVDDLQEKLQVRVHSDLEAARTHLGHLDRLDFLLQSKLERARLRLSAVADIGRIVLDATQTRHQKIDRLEASMTHCVSTSRMTAQGKLARLEMGLICPDVEVERKRIGNLQSSLERLLAGDISLKRERLSGLTKRLKALDIQSVLNRGYSVVTDTKGRVVRDAGDLAQGDALKVQLPRGLVHTQVTRISRK